MARRQVADGGMVSDMEGSCEYIEWECLLLFGTESFVFQFAIQKVKDQDI